MCSRVSFLVVLAATSLAAVAAQQDRSCFKNSALKRAKYTKCDDSLFDIHEVKMTALFNRRTKRHPLVLGSEVEICISGRATGITEPVMGLQNQAHGDLPLLSHQPFCDVIKDGCKDLTPPCQPGGPAIQPGQEFCYCSALNVPTVAPLIDVGVTWKILGLSGPAEDKCETEFEPAKVGKLNLACLQIPTTLKLFSPKARGK